MYLVACAVCAVVSTSGMHTPGLPGFDLPYTPHQHRQLGRAAAHSALFYSIQVFVVTHARVVCGGIPACGVAPALPRVRLKVPSTLRGKSQTSFRDSETLGGHWYRYHESGATPAPAPPAKSSSVDTAAAALPHMSMLWCCLACQYQYQYQW